MPIFSRQWLAVSLNPPVSSVPVTQPSSGSWKLGLDPSPPQALPLQPWKVTRLCPLCVFPRPLSQDGPPLSHLPASLPTCLVPYSTLPLEDSLKCKSHPASTLLRTPHRCSTPFRIKSQVLQPAWDGGVPAGAPTPASTPLPSFHFPKGTLLGCNALPSPPP